MIMSVGVISLDRYYDRVVKIHSLKWRKRHE